MVVNIVNNLKSLGFTEYEARIYGALLEHHPSSPYEAAKNAGVPTSKVYEVIAKLAERGLVLEVGEPDRRQYIPLEPQEFLRREKQNHLGVVEALEKDFSSLGNRPEVSYLWSLRSLQDFNLRAGQLMASARETLLLSLWEEDIPLIIGPHKQAMERGIKAATVVFGEGVLPDLGQVYPHPIRDTLHQERGGRGFVLVADSQQVLWGTFSAGGVEGVWSRNPGFVTLAEDYVKHDIYIMKLVSRYGEDMLRRFGPGYKSLRDIYSDQEDV